MRQIRRDVLFDSDSSLFVIGRLQNQEIGNLTCQRHGLEIEIEENTGGTKLFKEQNESINLVAEAR
jgi:hypothetical protein